MKKETFITFSNIAFAVAILCSDVLYILFPHMPYVYKVIASSLFVLCALSNLIYMICVKKFISLANILIFVGLVFAMLGDILLIDYFLVGAIFFAIGHLFFLIAFYALKKFSYFDIICGGVLILFSLLVIFLYKGFEFNGMKAIVIVYAIIISIMLGKSISNLITSKNKIFSLIIMLGALLFFVSDMMLLFNVFANLGKVFDIICLLTYYPAVFLLALSIALNMFLNKNEKVKLPQNKNEKLH